MRAITTPLKELNEYEQINKYLEKPFACAEVTGCVDSQKLHFIDSLGADFKYRIIVTYSDLRAKEIYEDYKFYDRNVTENPHHETPSGRKADHCGHNFFCPNGASDKA